MDLAHLRHPFIYISETIVKPQDLQRLNKWEMHAGLYIRIFQLYTSRIP